MKLNTLHDLLIHEIQDLYSAGNQMLEALPKVMEATSNTELKTAFEEHLKQTKEQVKRLETVCKDLDIKPEGHTCKGMQGLIKEGEEIIKLASKSDPEVIDAALIGAAQRIEHYEIAGYGCAITYAKLMKHTKAVEELKKTIDEEEKTDKKLSKIAETCVNKNANSM